MAFVVTTHRKITLNLWVLLAVGKLEADSTEKPDSLPKDILFILATVGTLILTCSCCVLVVMTENIITDCDNTTVVVTILPQ
jgi:hypothetical protein